MAKVAMRARAALIVTLQVPVPVQLPLQPVKVAPAAGAGVRVTTVPVVRAVEQVAPQEIPAGELVTVPLPVPDLVTVRGEEDDDCTNAAVTEVASFIVPLQAPVPAQTPPRPPELVAPAAGAAVKVTTVPVVKAVEHVAPQEIPVGLLVTVPLFAPVLEIVRVGPVVLSVPVTNRVSVSPSALKLTFVLDS